MSAQKVAIRYIGKKNMKRDTTRAKSGTVWFGTGDVKSVPLDVAKELVRHTDVWQYANGSVRHKARSTHQQVQIDTDDHDDTPISEKEFHQPPRVGEEIDQQTFEDLFGDDDEESDVTEEDLNLPPADKIDDDKTIADIIRGMTDAQKTPTGIPRVDEVRRLTNNVALPVKRIRDIWNSIKDE